ncbi:MAG: ABC transporter permease [Syntrophales bacterium]
MNAISGRFWRVWRRNLAVYRQNWMVSFMTPMLEPFLYLLAFGVGFSRLVGDVPYGGTTVPYTLFLAPALVAMTVMNNAFFENTYGSFVRMYYQKTFDAMMATPLTVSEIITGEIVWGATKAVIATAIMMVVIGLFGLLRWPEAFLLLPLAFLGGIAFGSVGMVFTAVTPHIELFNLPFFLFITPMYLFGGTFFPLEALPEWARQAALVLPLTHLVNITRALSIGFKDLSALWGFLYFLAFAAVAYPLALKLMHRRLVK